MVNHMKTTVELPDELLIEAKKLAAEQRRPLRALIEEGLRSVIEGPRRKQRAPVAIEWVTVEGGLPEGIDPSDRAAMREALSRSQ